MTTITLWGWTWNPQVFLMTFFLVWCLSYCVFVLVTWAWQSFREWCARP